jgi:membrane protein DedA with SNARE-associated domain
VTELSDWLLTGLLNHGSTLLGVTLFFAALGIPLPASMLLMAAGAFTRQGVLPMQEAVLSAAAGAVAGDACSYALGRFSLKMLPAKVHNAGSWQRATALFARWGGWSVFISRFLLTPVALPVNLLAGSTGYAWPRFMTAVVAGQLIWIFLFGGIGHYFANQWADISQLAGDVAGLLLGVALLMTGVWAVVKSLR